MIPSPSVILLTYGAAMATKKILITVPSSSKELFDDVLEAAKEACKAQNYKMSWIIAHQESSSVSSRPRLG